MCVTGVMFHPDVDQVHLFIYDQEFYLHFFVHVHNNRINFQKTDGVLATEGQLLVTVCLQVAVPLSH